MINLINKIAEAGSEHLSAPHLKEVEIFKSYFVNGELSDLSRREGNCTRRELAARFLLLNAVLDQGSDTEGVRELLSKTINYLYDKEIRVLHTPLNFFKELGIVIDKVDDVHEAVRKVREKQWRDNNKTNKKYNLFMDGTTQTLSYAVFRWGVPLSVPLVLQKNDEDNPEALLSYLEKFGSAELMSVGLKDDKKYGLGKAIGDKAAHLFAKWLVYTFKLLKNAGDNWGRYSYEIPFDSNAGRVFWRTGLFLHYVTEAELEKAKVIQRGGGKGGKHYLRITNIRGIGATKNLDEINADIYGDLCVKHLKTSKRTPKKIELQRIPIALLCQSGKYSVGELDDGLMYIGTNFCFNHASPECPNCPLKDVCAAHTADRKLTEEYRA